MEAIYEINLKIAPLQLNKSQYLSRIEGSPPKRNVAGSTPVWDATNSAESLILQGFQRFLIYGFLFTLNTICFQSIIFYSIFLRLLRK